MFGQIMEIKDVIESLKIKITKDFERGYSEIVLYCLEYIDEILDDMLIK